MPSPNLLSHQQLNLNACEQILQSFARAGGGMEEGGRINTNSSIFVGGYMELIKAAADPRYLLFGLQEILKEILPLIHLTNF